MSEEVESPSLVDYAPANEPAGTRSPAPLIDPDDFEPASQTAEETAPSLPAGQAGQTGPEDHPGAVDASGLELDASLVDACQTMFVPLDVAKRFPNRETLIEYVTAKAEAELAWSMPPPSAEHRESGGNGRAPAGRPKKPELSKLILEGEQWDQPLVEWSKSIHGAFGDHQRYLDERDALNEALIGQMYQQVRALADYLVNETVEQWFVSGDEAIAKLFGSGRTEDLRADGVEALNRKKLIAELKSVSAGGGPRNGGVKALMQRAMHAGFPEYFKEAARAELAKKTDRASRQSTARPTRAEPRARAPDGTDAPINRFKADFARITGRPASDFGE